MSEDIKLNSKVVCKTKEGDKATIYEVDGSFLLTASSNGNFRKLLRLSIHAFENKANSLDMQIICERKSKNDNWEETKFSLNSLKKEESVTLKLNSEESSNIFKLLKEFYDADPSILKAGKIELMSVDSSIKITDHNKKKLLEDLLKKDFSNDELKEIIKCEAKNIQYIAHLSQIQYIRTYAKEIKLKGCLKIFFM